MAEHGPLEGEDAKIGSFEHVMLDIMHIITCLYRFSITIQSPAPKERLHKIALINMSHFEDWDIQHINGMFYPVDPENNFRVEKGLSNRLGKANTKRRQLLKYYETHHKKISKHIDNDIPSSRGVSEGNKPTNAPKTVAPTVAPTVESGSIKAHVKISDLEEIVTAEGATVEESATVEGVDTVDGAATIGGADTVYTSTQSQTTVSTMKGEPSYAVEIEQDDDQRSQTSYATTINHKQRIHVPPPPNEDAAYADEPFECPYCFTITKIRNRQDWKYVGNYTCSILIIAC